MERAEAASAEPVSINLLSDDPRDGSPERPDDLGRHSFTTYLASLVDTVRAQSESSVMALIGDWGSGKTSILELLRKHLTSRRSDSWLLAEFNPWTYPDAPSLQHGFFNELAAALPKGSRPSGARAKVGDLARTISPIGKLGGIIGVDAEGVITTIADLVSGDTSASAAKRSAEAALRRLQRPVLMVVDDLDRLTPQELLEVLKLVRLVGRLPHVYYLLAYDERTLLDVLQNTPIAGGNESRARAYLEKIVQVRLDMPVLRESQRSVLLNRGLTSILTSNSAPLTAADQRRLSEIYFEVLDRRLATPRAISRFLGQVQAFFGPLRGEVDFVDFLLMTWLRTQEPGVYAMVQRERDALLGRASTSWRFGGRDATAAKERQRFWSDRIERARVDSDHRDGVIRVLSDLFPEIQAAFASASSFTTAGQRSTPKAVSHADYFDRYVSFGVPEDDFPDSLLSQSLGELARGIEGRPVQRLKAEIRDNTARAARKIEGLRDSGETLPEVAIFELFGELWPQLDDTPREIFDDPRRSAEHGAALALVRAGSEAAAEAVARRCAQPETFRFSVNVVRALHRNARSPYGSFVPPGFDLEGLVDIVRSALSAWHSANRFDSPFADGAMSGFWPWVELDPAAAHGWLRERVDSGAWPLVEVVGALTSLTVPIGVPGASPNIGEFASSTADDVFGLERVLAELSAELDAVAPLEGDVLRIPATRENRISYALSALRRMRKDRSPDEVGEARPMSGVSDES
ncbi:AAA family ATPase [Cellulomonas sp. JZ18]|uniref:KAP family P-loop NTPase fold protein n=1 Tax=Cellulomonas sp. JZ18 TaxID=2654191 RepID=UPI0012D4AFC5|nr:P-loop NTPase fold protein [Cellulomonas sp. JZ18]QGQ20226.1 AAA family ATPase [Cellulomonas sp. JZ18]